MPSPTSAIPRATRTASHSIVGTYEAPGDIRNTRIAAGIEQDLTRAAPTDSGGAHAVGRDLRGSRIVRAQNLRGTASRRFSPKRPAVILKRPQFSGLFSFQGRPAFD